MSTTTKPVRAFLYALKAIDDEGFHLIRDRKAETVIDRDTFISWAAKGSIDPMSLVNYGLNAWQASKSTASDLLAALEEITERYEQLDRRLVAGQHAEPNGTISRAKAAIAKAKTLSA